MREVILPIKSNKIAAEGSAAAEAAAAATAYKKHQLAAAGVRGGIS
jgi:hypothetical protein